mmetsp:Transcript_37172/g.71279  ORF Transcript_37172/g.71279 Transcript_37172/m.71279 type:complete len:251 (-) Transcript_37172:229-981(-)
MAVPHRPFSINLASPLPQVAAEIQVLCKQLLPGWMGLHLSAMQVAPMAGGVTNSVFKVTPVGYVSDVPLPPVVVRIFGQNSENFVNRPAEIEILKQLNHYGFGARVVGTFDNGRVELFINATTLSHLDMQQSHLRNRIARRLKKLHDCKISRIPKEPQLWVALERMLDKVSAVTEISTSHIREELAVVREACALVHSPVVFCHNDLTPGNIMFDKQKHASHEDGLYIIDFEYADYSFRGYKSRLNILKWW